MAARMRVTSFIGKLVRPTRLALELRRFGSRAAPVQGRRSVPLQSICRVIDAVDGRPGAASWAGPLGKSVARPLFAFAQLSAHNQSGTIRSPMVTTGSEGSAGPAMT